MEDEKGEAPVGLQKGAAERPDGERHVFKPPPPRTSLLGLDKLAAQKRAEKGIEPRSVKRPRIDYSDGDDEASDMPTKKDPKRGDLTRKYRGKHMETPSHPGGVNRDALESIAKRDYRRKERHRVTVERERHQSREHSDRRRRSHRDSSRERGSHRDHDRRRASESDRVRPSSSYRGTEREWEMTPLRSGHGSGPRSSYRSNRSSRPDSSNAWDFKLPGPPPSQPGAARGSVSVSARQSRVRFDTSQTSVLRSQRPDRSVARSERSPDVEFEQQQAVEFDEQLQREFEAEQIQLDRDWYDQEEFGRGVDENRNPFLGDDALMEKRKTELQEKFKRRDGSTMTLAQSKRASELQRDINAWEENRLVTSGVARYKEVNLDFEMEDNERIILLVHDTKPPFLNGKTMYSKQSGPVVPLKDPTSDMAVIARQGSQLVKETRDKKEKNKFRERFWEVAGSKIGTITGLTGKEEEEAKKAKEEEMQAMGLEEDEEEEGEGDRKTTALFKDHMQKGKSEGASNFSKTKTMTQQRRSLPVYQVREDLMQVIRENQVVVVVGETGSGKTTQMTQYLHEDGYTRSGMIGCTQPRRVAAMSVAKRVSEEMDIELGKEVGYSIRFEDCTDRKKTVIKYMTDGVLLRETLTSDDLDTYSVIIMDEAHERSLGTDVLFGILKKVVARRRDLRLIVTSATLDANKFADFFGSIPIFHIPGRTFPVETLWSKTPQEDYVLAAVKTTITIHLESDAGDVLIFLTGQEEIETACFALQERMEHLEQQGLDKPLMVLPIYSQLPADLQAKIFDKAPDGVRKCIVATPIAETSLTVDGILYVIDSGFGKTKVYNPKIGMDALQVFPVSQAAANQRKGRAGRTAPGKCYRLYTETAFSKEMLETSVPEIQRTNLAQVVLLLKSLNIENLLEFDFMDPPPQENILNSMYQLWILGALDNTGGLTPLGRKIVDFPLDPPLAKMLLKGADLGCSDEILTIVSMLSVPSIFFRPPERAEESDAAREKFFAPESDHLTLLHVYRQWKANNYRSSWCTQHFLHARGLRKAKEVRSQLLDIMKAQNIPVVSCGLGNWDIVRKAICSAYFQNAAKFKGVGEYVNCRTGMPAHLHASSALFGLGYTPDYVVYHELVYTSKEYMQSVTAVDPEWLAELGPMFFDIKVSHTSRLDQRKKEQEHAKAMEIEMEAAKQRKVESEKVASEAKEAQRIKEQSKIVTPGVKSSATPYATPLHKRRFGL
ncbi:hypothetical protein BSKO_06331 [Bryopsis sp. KO-2023]|nr:hypothetical protein BSKO_06331 [Bryopsis sp. KO-2023]